MNTVTSPDGTPIGYDRTGTGEPLVLVGGTFSYRRYPGQVKLASLGRASHENDHCGDVHHAERRDRSAGEGESPHYDEELNQAVLPQLASAGTHLCGRRSHECLGRR
jgi:hypothetical protein